jgi:hypothetical protein
VPALRQAGHRARRRSGSRGLRSLPEAAPMRVGVCSRDGARRVRPERVRGRRDHGGVAGAIIRPAIPRPPRSATASTTTATAAVDEGDVCDARCRAVKLDQHAAALRSDGALSAGASRRQWHALRADDAVPRPDPEAVVQVVRPVRPRASGRATAGASHSTGCAATSRPIRCAASATRRARCSPAAALPSARGSA